MYLTRRFYVAALVVVLLLGSGQWYAPLFVAGKVALCVWVLAVAVDVALLYAGGARLDGVRRCADRLSNGDDNPVRLEVMNAGRLPLRVTVVDEAPVEFQRRDLSFRFRLPPGGQETSVYTLRPVRRGEYRFGHMRLFASTTWAGLVERRFTVGVPSAVKVYPSYLMLRHYELLAIHNHLTDLGIKRIRRVGHQTDFEHIRDYVQGDDYRTVNWKATARRHQLMVNVYRDERSQQVYNLIDKGRVMQQTFGGMTLLDYAVNASLVFSYVAIRREDKAGLVTFADHFETFVPASRQEGQMTLLSESLYKERTAFGETDFSALCVHLEKRVTKRSLAVLYTNFTTLVEARRQLPFLQNLSRRHCLLVVFFEDDDVRAYAASEAATTEDYYRRVIAEKFIHEKRQIVALLKQHGIMALLTSPARLTVDVINKYIEIKTRELL